MSQPAAWMLTLAFGGLVMAALWHLVATRPWAALAAFFVLFSLVTRTAAVAYLDLAGPVYAVELNDEVGGGGSSMPLFALSVLAFIVPLAFMFRRGVVMAWLPSLQGAPKARLVSNVAFAVLSIFLVALYGDMFARGTIPLFSGMDRLEYNKIAGPLHAPAYEFVFMFGFAMGTFFVYPRVRGHDFDLRFAWLALFYFVYHALTGSRFSIFYAFAGYAVIPFAAVSVLRHARALKPPPRRRPALLRAITSKSALPVLVTVVSLALAALVLNSVINVRAYDDPSEQLSQRILVQPVELWWSTWNTLSPSGAGDSGDTWYSTFIKPIDPTRNTSIQVLMVKNLGDERAEELIEMGQQYAGGYPEILFELFGPWAALPIALVFGVVSVALLRLCVASVCRGHIITALLAVYVCFGFNLLYLGGMLNFLIAWTFGVKVLALAIAFLVESGATRLRLRYRRRSRVRPAPALS